MINRIIEFSAANKFIVIFLTIAAALSGWWSLKHVTLDAIPDLSDTQVIVYSRWDRSADVIENQVTYPIVTSMLGAPHVRAVRGFSEFGFSYVYVVFDEGTDIYWARSRTLEYLSSVSSRLPQGVRTELGPDATGLGWVFQYVLEDKSKTHSLAELRSFQDWRLRYYLKSVQGVADVASLGGYVQQYQVNVDPNKLQAYGVTITHVADAVRGGNNDIGGRVIEFAGTEYIVRGRGYARSLGDIENLVVATTDNGSAVRVADIGQVVLGPDLRRGVSDLDGLGEAVSGIVIMRQGENALDVIDRVKAKLREIEPGLPEGVSITPVYDRSDLIKRSIDTLRSTLIEIMITVALVILLFLRHVPSALVPLVTIPVSVLVAFIPFRFLGMTANVMSLGGIAITVGALADAAIIMVEQTHKKLEAWDRGGRREDSRDVILNAVMEVGGPSFFALLATAISFLPILALEAQEGRLFRPLAYTKILSMAVAAVLVITLDPAIRLLFTRTEPFALRPAWFDRLANALIVGTIQPEERNPISRFLFRIYQPVAVWALKSKWLVIGAAFALIASAFPVYSRLGSEFMPPLDEGTLLYMPTTMPGISIAEAQKLLQTTDAVIKGFPEVARVFGKAGRAETPTDPAPLSMMETVITLRPRSEWREVATWYSAWAPEWAKTVLRRITSDRLSPEALTTELNAALKVPGVANAWTMPIRGRIDMLTTGMRTAAGVKISGSDLATIESIGKEIEALLPAVAGTRGVFAERAGSGYYLDIDWNRDELVRNGVSLESAQAAVQQAIGGDNVTTAIDGRARYPVNVRYMRDFRTDLGALGRVLVPASGGQRQISLGQIATIKTVTGPSMIRDENGLLTGYVYVDLAGRDAGGYVDEAARFLREKIKLPPGYALSWSGQYEGMQRVEERLFVVVPLTLFLIVFLLFLNTRSVSKTLIILLAAPFSAVGAIWFLWLLGYNMSVGVWVGLVALLGLDAAGGVFMLLYLDLAYEDARREGRMNTPADLQRAILNGSVKRIRPKVMTAACMFFGLVPILLADGSGADVMKRIAAPMIGGIFTSFVLELLVYPSLYQIWKQRIGLR